MKRRYRIVTDKYLGFEVQVRYQFFPFWLQAGFCNTFATIERCESFIERHRAGHVVKYVEDV